MPIQCPPNPPVMFIMGPTASGKTDLALALADTLPCELISVDSALIYRGMDIGTAKPDAETLRAYPHHLVDILDPLDSYSAARFRQDALTLMRAAVEKQRLPVLVGGTMLYYKALLEGLATMPAADPEVREQLLQQVEQEGLLSLYQQLQTVDPESAARLHPNDTQRIVRAVEVWRVSGKTMTQYHQQQQAQRALNLQLPYTVLPFAIAPQQRHIVHERIEQRFQAMLEQGFIDEVEALLKRGDLHAELPSMRAVGYRQVWEYLHGQTSYDEMVAKATAATRQLAKRQFTWLRSWSQVDWLDSLAQNNLELLLKKLPASPILN